LKSLSKEFKFDEADRFRAFTHAKQNDFISDLEKQEKKFEIGLMRERDQIR